MKKLFTLLFLSSFLSGFSQEKETTDFKRNELKVNALMLVAGAFEFTYERILNEESAVGISLFVPYDNTIDTNFSLSPYYRFYFGKKPAAGFFAEGFGMLNNYDYSNYISNNGSTPIYDEGSATDFALGFGLGGKWITKKGFVFEINSGVGRNLFNSTSKDSEIQNVGRGRISLSYRF